MIAPVAAPSTVSTVSARPGRRLVACRSSVPPSAASPCTSSRSAALRLKSVSTTRVPAAVWVKLPVISVPSVAPQWPTTSRPWFTTSA